MLRIIVREIHEVVYCVEDDNVERALQEIKNGLLIGEQKRMGMQPDKVVMVRHPDGTETFWIHGWGRQGIGIFGWHEINVKESTDA